MIDCQKLSSDIEKLRTLCDELSNQLESSSISGTNKTVLSSLSSEASSSAEMLLEEYAYDLVEQNINDPSGRNSEFLDSILRKYLDGVEEKDEQNQGHHQDQTDSNIAKSDMEDESELEPESEIIITPDTTIDEVRNNLEQYLKADPKLDSNLVVYALKEQLKLLPNQTDNPDIFNQLGIQVNGPSSDNMTIIRSLEELCKNIVPDSLRDKTLPRLAYLHKIAERVKNLEVLETENYIFMLPKDKWEEDKIRLPNPEYDPSAPEFVAPRNLTAILKSPVYYDWGYETDYQSGKNTLEWVYDESWIGKEIHHFPWSKELIEEADEKLLKPNGFTIPIEWKPVVDSLKSQLAKEQGVLPLHVPDSDLIVALRDRLHMTFSGNVYKGLLDNVGSIGVFWSKFGYADLPSRYLGDTYRHSLYISRPNYVNPTLDYYRPYAGSVRCVSTPRS